MSIATLTEVSFKMLVVCELYPPGRQWLHSLFGAMRGQRKSPINLAREVSVDEALHNFERLLFSDESISLPLTCREHFPFADCEHLMVVYADASGLSRMDRPLSPVLETPPGYGGWTVRAKCLYIIEGLWRASELEEFHISELEYITTFWCELVFLDICPSVSHVLEFTDNSGTEWSARKETPSAENMQRITAARSSELFRRGVYVRTCRVTSSENTWADDLSRGRKAKVVAEAQALGLHVLEVQVPETWRSLAWLRNAR